jgi:hypothetical protein
VNYCGDIRESDGRYGAGGRGRGIAGYAARIFSGWGLWLGWCAGLWLGVETWESEFSLHSEIMAMGSAV